ncbi:MAG: hypothetical protein ACI81T_001974 [Bacteroidia bacterium]|jgi:hypothetical protein
MSMMKSLFLGIITTLLLMFGVGYFLPNQYNISHKMVVPCEIAQTFEQVNTLQNWENWAFDSLQTHAGIYYLGANFGEGAIYTWKTQDAEGRVEIMESINEKKIRLESSLNQKELVAQFEFLFKSLNQAKSGTEIEWIQKGELNSIQMKYLLFFGILEGIIEQDMSEKMHALEKYCNQEISNKN